MKIGIMGSRGIPNRYGGFEQLAQYLSAGLTRKQHEVFVYNPRSHSYKENNWVGVNIIRCPGSGHRLESAGQFIYDWNCIADARKRNFDILLHLGYTSDSIWHRRWPGKNTVNMVNMDGLEWKREKYSRPVKRFLKWAESLAAKNAPVVIADSPVIQQYLKETYGVNAVYIPYGADIFNYPDPDKLKAFDLSPKRYYLVIARMEPENNTEMIIRGYLASGSRDKLVITGNTTNRFGKYLKNNYSSSQIIFPGPLFDPEMINNLRYFSSIYFHGHSAGGTNPSLLEAMGCRCPIAAHNNIFNKTVLGNDAEYFSSAGEISAIINNPLQDELLNNRAENNIKKIETIYTWDKITGAYEELMRKSLDSFR